ncbi:YigZ family protein [Ureaplasma miroungigenitalium]|uniref:YigZ family protein n=1 Tax=Ureaplasma miroungigenitalium TaxID=1042321 RepID=A0ABT3BNC8_9BACT|nr:YigZ family protein [Ureaplasma miroungigenitalium]MCV3728749.1 YigZ family protein [Ureaplasma miroungigenitalium]MCV3734525.1 YigZ family protein [Ureaplasma miroungigenitalium]
MQTFKTIKQSKQNKYNINKSNFYGFLYPVNNEHEVETLLNELRRTYYDATHIVYAYRYWSGDEVLIKADDDNEPKNSAGMMILNNLLKYDLVNNMICIVRYFGKVKLGLSKLKNVYKNVSEQIILDSLITDFVIKYPYEIRVHLTNMIQFDRFMSQDSSIEITNKYQENGFLIVQFSSAYIYEDVHNDHWSLRTL